MRPAVKDFTLRIAGAALAALILAPFVGALLPQTPFHRVLTRLFLIGFVLALAVGRGPIRSWPSRWAAMGLHGPDRARRFLAGAAVAIALFCALLFLSWALGGRVEPAQPYPKTLLVHLGKAFVSAMLVSFLEEVLCRGYMKDVLGGPLSAILYAGAHFFRPAAGSAPAGEGLDPLLGFKRFPELLEAWAMPQNFTLGFLSLFLFGLALNRLRERTGTLYLGIGVHAGLVFSIDLYRRFLSDAPAGDPWIFGGGRLHDGLLGTLALALLLWGSYRMPLPRNGPRLRADY